MRYQVTINVWVGITGDLLMGPYKLLPELSGTSHIHFLMEELPQLLEDVPLVTQQMWFMHDGAPTHFTRNIKQFLHSHYPAQWAEQNRLVLWPPQLPSLTPADFYLWGHLKCTIYSKSHNTLLEVFSIGLSYAN
jgi:hypothetical protein